jgi:hypothetical protein
LPSPWSRRWSCCSAGGAGDVAGMHKQRGSAIATLVAVDKLSG